MNEYPTYVIIREGDRPLPLSERFPEFVVPLGSFSQRGSHLLCTSRVPTLSVPARFSLGLGFVESNPWAATSRSLISKLYAVLADSALAVIIT
jgi:hypothetical protein